MSNMKQSVESVIISLTEWQSKDGECDMSVLNPVDVECFYELCPKCSTWNEYRVKPLVIEIVPDEELREYQK